MNDVEEITIVSNRLPVVMHHNADGWQVESGTGGLVQAMNPILERMGGRWIGWPGLCVEDGSGWLEPLHQVSTQVGFEMNPVILTRAQVDGFYAGFSNSVIWPLFHGFADRCDFDARFYEIYHAVNEKFADVITACANKNDLLWVHDYHLMHVGQWLRMRGRRGPLCFFLHIPFPSPENYTKLPWRKDILQALLAYDLVGLQTERDRNNFVQCIERVLPDVLIHEVHDTIILETQTRRVQVGVFPISTDFADFSRLAASDEVQQRMLALREQIGPYQVLLGIDRLDYTKGLIERLLAFEQALKQFPELMETVVLFQLVIPSRENVQEYRTLKRELDRLVGRINGRFSTPAWQPIRYLYNTVEPPELCALYRLASAAVVTPLRDGMNLVAKEYCACQVDETGVLILSEFAGAAATMDGAIRVNPYDINELSKEIHTAVTMNKTERTQRMRVLREHIRTHDVFWWAKRFLDAAQHPIVLDAAHNTLRPPGPYATSSSTGHNSFKSSHIP